MTLKYEGKFKIGDRIKALDFAGDNDYWIAGTIIGTGTRRGAKVFEIEIDTDTLAERRRKGGMSQNSGRRDSRVGDIGFVPMECLLGDRLSDDRVTLLERRENGK